MARLLLVLLASGAVASAQRLSVPIPHADRPVTVHLDAATGSVRAVGVAGLREVELDSGSPPARRGGEETLRILRVDEGANSIRLWSDGRNRAEVTLRVPARANLSLRTLNSGSVRVENVEGEIEASASNGDIMLAGVRGSAIANTLNGKIEAEFRSVDPAKPMAFTTLNGSLNLAFPPGLKANVRLKTENGKIETDFEMAVSSGRPPDDTSGRQRWRSDGTIYGRVNGGGSEIRISTLNGGITIRKSTP